MILTLEKMQHLSIDEIINLYKIGYRLDKNPPIITSLNPTIDPTINFGKVTVTSLHNNTDTSIGISDSSRLPNPSVSGNFNLIWWNSDDYPDPSDDPNREIVRCTANSSNTLTVTRGQEGISASNKNTTGKTYKMVLSVTAKTISDIQTDAQNRVDTHSALTTGIHGVSGNYVAIASGSQYTAVNKAGDTMSGTLNLPANGLAVGTNQLIVSGGNVGVGTSSPNYKLDIGNQIALNNNNIIAQNTASASQWISKRNAANTGDGIQLITQNSSNADTSRFRITSGVDTASAIFVNTVVGIGTSSINTKLDIVSTDGNGSMSINPSTAVRSANTPALKIYDQQDTTDPNIWSGSVLIQGKNSSSQTAPLLSMYNYSASPQVGIYLMHNGSGPALRIDKAGTGYGLIVTGGNVGIGTTSPSDICHIDNGNLTVGNSTAVSNHINLYAATNQQSSIQFFYGSTSEYQIVRPSNSTDLRFYNGDWRVTFQAGGNVGIGTTSPFTNLTLPASKKIGWDYTSGQANSRRWVILSDSIIFGDLDIATETSQGNNTFNNHRIYIDNNGNVGIGTTGPVSILDVHANSTETTYPWNTGLLRINNDNTTNGIFSEVDFLHGSSTNGSIALKKISGNNSDFVFWINNGTSLSERLRITGDGKVGIGTGGPTSNLDVSGSVSMKINTITGNTTLDSTYHTVLCNASSSTITTTLPTAVGITGRIYNIKKIDSSTNQITISTTSSQTIDGSTSRTITAQYETVTVQSDGANWYIL